MERRGGKTFQVDVSNEGKLLFPDEAITKGDLVGYYRSVAEVMLPHLRGRPITMHRFPNGIHGPSFFQQDVPDRFPEWIHRARVDKEGGTLEHVLIADAETLAYLANLACIPIHVWLSRIDRPDNPDAVVWDLDPSDDNFEVVRETAFALRNLLEELGLSPFVKTTGSRGLHVAAPLDRSATFAEARPFAQDVARLLVHRDHERLTTEPRKAKRGDRLYIDTLRNAYAQTWVAPYSVRPKPGAPVSMPVQWKELEDPRLKSNSFTLRNALGRMAPRGDAWARMYEGAPPLAGARRRLDEILAKTGKAPKA